MPTAHQIHPDRVTRADQVTQRLLLIAGNPDRVQLARQQQPHQMLGVAAIGLHAIPARPRDLARRRDHTLHATLDQLARQPIPGWAGLIRHPHRPRQTRAEPGRPRGLAVHRERLQLPGLGVQTAATIFVACTSRPTRVLAFAMAGSSYAVVGRRAGAAARQEPHPTTIVGEPATSTPRAGRSVNPYGPGVEMGCA